MTDERSENERWYDENIAPRLAELANACGERGLNFFSAVEYDKDSRAETRRLPNESLAMEMLAILCATGVNIDGFMINLKRHCDKRGIDTSASIFMRLGQGRSA